MIGSPRAWLLGLFLIGAVGIAADLLLTEHFADRWQQIPLGLLGLALAAGAACAGVAVRATLRALQAVAALLVAGGLAGLYLHYTANIEFAREIAPDLTGVALVWDAVRGAAPPSLAPGTLGHRGLLGFAYTYRHPAHAPARPITSPHAGDA
jgi:hypothetical protein